MDPTQDPSAGLDQQAIDAALNAYSQAAANANYWAQRAADAQNAKDAKGAEYAGQQADNARDQLGAASRDYSNLLGRLSIAYQANQRAAKDPNEQAMWAAEADKAKNQSDLYKSEADLYQAKTQEEMQSASQRAQAALQNAATSAQRAASTGALQGAEAALANAKLAALPELTTSTIALHNSQIQLAGARAQQSLANAALANAKTDVLIPAEAQRFLQMAGWDQARIDALHLTTPVKLDYLKAQTGLDDAKAQQILANIGKQQILPYTDNRSPTLTEFQPSTGQVTGIPNPGYVNTTLQGINDTEQAIQSIQNQIASGQMTPDQGTQLIANLRQALQYKALGVTPDQYVAMQNQQANLGRNVLSDYMGVLGQGRSAADQFMTMARGIRNLPAGLNLSPYATFGKIANQLYGGSLDNARALINQVQPVTDRFSALQAFSQLSQARQHLVNAAQQAGGSQPTPDASAAPANPTTGILPQQTTAAMPQQGPY